MMFQVASVRMHVNRFIRTLPVSPRFCTLIILIVLNAVTLIWVTPEHPRIIIGEIVLFSLTGRMLFRYVVSPLLSNAIGLFIATFLVMSWLVGFYILNTILLISAIIAVFGFISSR